MPEPITKNNLPVQSLSRPIHPSCFNPVLKSIRERVFPPAPAPLTPGSCIRTLLSRPIAPITASGLVPAPLISVEQAIPTPLTTARHQLQVLAREDAVAKSEEEAASIEPKHSFAEQAVQGIARGVVGPAVAIPFSTRETQLQNTPHGEAKPPLSKAFNNYGKQWKLQSPARVASSSAFMLALPPACQAVAMVTESECAQKVAPYAACSFVEAGVYSPISVINQQLRLKNNVTIIGIAKGIYQTDGIKGFYRSGLPHATASAVYNMIIFPISDEMIALANHAAGEELSDAAKVGLGFVAGSAATLSTLPLLNPVYRIIGEQKQQRTGSDRPPQSFWQTGKQIAAVGAARPEGALRGVCAELYKGSSVSVIRAPISGGVIIMINQLVKSQFESGKTVESAT